MPEVIRPQAKLRAGGALLVFFGLKVGLGLLILRASTSLLDKSGFVIFSQLFLWLALLATISAAGLQNGLTRQIALARGNPACERHSMLAAGRIWVAAVAAMLLASTVFAPEISVLLAGDGSLNGIVALAGLLAAGSAVSGLRVGL